LNLFEKGRERILIFHIRVANIGALTNQNIDGFLSAFQSTLEKAPA